MSRVLLFALMGGLLAAVAALPQITPPLVGYLIDGGELCPLYGVRGNFVLGDPLWSDVRGLAASDSVMVVETGTEILLLHRSGGVLDRWDRPSRQLLLAVSAEGQAWIFDRLSGEITLWREGRRTSTIVPPIPGEPVALGPGWFVLARDDKLWRWDPVTLEQRELPAASAPLLVRPDGSIAFAREGDLVIRAEGGEERAWTLPEEAQAFASISANWLTVVTRGAGRRYLWNGGEWFLFPERE